MGLGIFVGFSNLGDSMIRLSLGYFMLLKSQSFRLMSNEYPEVFASVQSCTALRRTSDAPRSTGGDFLTNPENGSEGIAVWGSRGWQSTQQ